MAITTRNKRFSMLNFGDGNNFHLLPNPDGEFDEGDRLQLLDLYNILSPPGGSSVRRTDRTLEARRAQVIYEDEEVLMVILTMTRLID